MVWEPHSDNGGYIMSVMNEKQQKQNITIVIPTMNEVENIKEVFPNIPDFVDEIVVVDGNSTDGTRDEIIKFRKDAKIIIEKPSGKGAAIKTGFKNATGDLIIMMDADGSHNPREITGLLKPILNGYDVAKGSRLLPGGGSAYFTPFRKLGNMIFVSMVNTLYGSKYTDLCYGYRAFKKEALERIYSRSTGFEIETEQSILMVKAGLKIKEVPSFEELRKNGTSNLHAFRDGWRILNVIMKEYLKQFYKTNNKNEKKHEIHKKSIIKSNN